MTGENLVGNIFRLIGLLALGLLVWFGAPLIEINGKFLFSTYASRVILFLVIVGLFLLKTGIKLLIKHHANNKLIDKILNRTASMSTAKIESFDQEMNELRARFKEALQFLKTTRLTIDNKQAYLSELPWYLVAGMPNSGKTTLLSASGLEFPLDKHYGKKYLYGDGYSRDCEWWFSTKAIFLDVSYRYNADAGDFGKEKNNQDAWNSEENNIAYEAFLDQLEQYLDERPLSGLIITIGVDQLLRGNLQQQATHIRAVRNRLQQLEEKFKIKFPVYILFTKCDVIAGFTEYFAGLKEHEREQIWGITFNNDRPGNGNFTKQFDVEYQGLLQRLSANLLDHLSTHSNIAQNHLIYNFPNQMATLKELFKNFLQQCFRPISFDDKNHLILRGVYFISAQPGETIPLDIINQHQLPQTGLVQKPLAAPQAMPQGFFIKELFNKVILGEAKLITGQKHKSLLQHIGYYLLPALVGISLLLTGLDYYYNNRDIRTMHSYLATYQQLTRVIDNSSTDFRAILPVLDVAQQMATLYDSDAWPEFFHLYSNLDLAKAAKSAFQTVLNKVFLPRVKQRLETLLVSYQDSPTLLYPALEAYLALSYDERVNKKVILSVMAYDWNSTYSDSPASITKLNHYLALAIQALHPMAVDQALIKQAMLTLNNLSPEEYAYQELQILAAAQPNLKIADLLGNDSAHALLGRQALELPYLYTTDGFNTIYVKHIDKVVSKAVSNAWLVNENTIPRLDPAVLAKIKQATQSLYFQDYQHYWDRVLMNYQLIEPTDLNQAVTVMKLITSDVSPLTRLLALANTQLQVLQTVPRTNVLASDLLAHMAGQQQSAKNMPTPPVLSQMTDFQNALPILQELSNYLTKMVSAPNTGDMAFQLMKAQLAGNTNDIFKRLDLAAAGSAEPVKAWLKSISKSTRVILLKTAQQYMSRAWRETVYPDCAQAITNTYPFMPTSTIDMSLKDFTHLFGYGGLLDSYFADYLKPFVDFSATPWRWDRSTGITFNERSLAIFYRAALIRKIFFPTNGQELLLNFTLTPQLLGDNIKRMELVVGEQKLVYAHGPIQAMDFKWPLPLAKQTAQLTLYNFNGVNQSYYAEGEWALFRLITQAKLQANPGAVIVSYANGQDNATLKINMRSNGTLSPLTAFSHFYCPSAL
jgi:type VI secretion system protein ImpL